MALDRGKIVWSEGMMLDRQHMQLWDRFNQNALNARVRSLSRFDWGLSALEVDKDRLLNGEFRLLHCKGVMPDGFVFDLPAHDPLPPPRNVQAHFPATSVGLEVFLTLPADRQRGRNITREGMTNQQRMRYQIEPISVLDEVSGVDDLQVEIARPNFELRFGEEPMEGYTLLQIATVVRGTNGFELDDQYVPACLSMAASEGLLTITRRLLEFLITESAKLTERARRTQLQRELSPSDARVLGLLRIVNSYIPVLNYYYAAAKPHPDVLYTTLATLGGELSAFALDEQLHPRDYLLYDHSASSASFDQLFEVIRRMLHGLPTPSNYIELRLDMLRENLYTAQVDQDVLSDAQLFIVARGGEIPEVQLITLLPRLMRMASPQTIDAVIDAAVPGLPLEHTTRLPTGMPVDQQANYFSLKKQGGHWDAIMGESSLAFHTQAELSALDLKLIAVLPQ